MRDKWDVSIAVLIAIVIGVLFGQPLGHPTQKVRPTHLKPVPAAR